MPRIRYPNEAVVQPAEQALTIECQGVNVRLPENIPGEEGSNSITFYFVAVDSGGQVVDRRPLTIPIPAGLQTGIDNLVNQALQRVANAGYPTGGTIE